MHLTEDELSGITRMGAAAYTPKQVRFAMGFEKNEFNIAMADEDSEVAAAYFKGFYSNELAIRESVFQLARNGSSPAQTTALKQFDDTRKSIKKDGITSEEI